MLSLLLAATLTVTDYATMPQPADPHFSPDGKRIAYVLTRADLERSAYDSDVWLIDTDGSNDLQLTHAPATDNHPRWSPDGKRIAFLSDRDGGKTAIWLIATNGGDAMKLTSEPTPVREFAWSPDGKSIAFTRLDTKTADEETREREHDDAHVLGANRKHSHLYVIDVESKAVRRLTSGDFSVWTLDWSPDGTTIVFDRAPWIGLDDLYHTDIWTINVADAAMKPLVVRPGLDRLPQYSPDGKRIAFTSMGGVHDWLLEHDLYVVAAGGGTPRVVSKDYNRTTESFVWSGNTIWFDGPWDLTAQLFRVNADGSGFTKVTSTDGVVADADVAQGHAAYIRQTLTEPPELFVDGRQLTHHNDELRTRTLGETRVIRWKAKDGLTIDGLLTLPVGYTKGTRVPLVTFVHGGPASRFDESFLGYLATVASPQVLASRGIAVLRPNPRGTGGYGPVFRGLNHNDWGGKDWLDINAGIDAVIKDGIADPARLGITGWSYGGYMAAWAIGHSDRFRAFSIGAPVVDLLSFHGTTDIRNFVPAYFDGMNLELLRERSPLWHLRKPRGPVLILQGEADDRVPLSQGIMLYRALEELGAHVTMVTYPRSGHGLREPKLRIDIARRNVDFFTDALTDH